jgi:ABC-2 type transport system permease protein
VAKAIFLGFLGILFWIGIYIIFFRVLIYFKGIEEIGDLLSERLLSMILLTFFSILIFSNMITSLSTFYVSEELNLILSSPVSKDKVFFSKFIETTIDSSWMVLSFGLPVFIAYGIVYHSPFYYYLGLPFILLPFIIIPAGLGITITILLSRVFPARRSRNFLFLLSIFAFILLYFLFRFLRPERFADPEAFGSLVGYLTELTVPSSPWLPSYWSTMAIFPLLKGAGEGLYFYFFMILSTALVSFLIVEWVSTRLYLDGWVMAQESKKRTISGWGIIEKALLIIRRPQRRFLILKDLKTFLRDTAQWSQLFLLLALVVVYLYNFKVLPFDRVPLASFYLKNLISFLNIGLAGLVLTATAARFIYPSISLEGQAYWIVKSSPTALKHFLWSKFWTGFIPLLFLAEILIIISNKILKVTDFMMALSTITIFIMTFGITGLGVGLGAIYPRFRFENAAQIPMGFGGVLYMILSMAFISITVVLEARPVYIYLWAKFIERVLRPQEILNIILSFSAVIILNILAFYLPMRLGLKSLEKRDI